MTSETIVNMQVPMPKAWRDALDNYAREQGFDSAQAFVRFIAKAVADDRMKKAVDGWKELNQATLDRLDSLAVEAKMGKKVTPPYSGMEAQKYIYKI